MTDKTTTEIAPVSPTAVIAAEGNFLKQFQDQVQQARAMRQALAQVMKELMKENVHYGVMPGTSTKEGDTPKKVLFKAGAEMLCNVFHLVPRCQIVQRVEQPTFIHFEVHCSVHTIGSDVVVAEADGSANTREERYYNQCTSKLCPVCHKPTIFKSKNPPYGWFCWEKKGGCKAEFAPEDKAIMGQDGQLTEVKVWSLHNTIVQQANKRAMVAAVRLATACSDTFTQDILPEPGDDAEAEPPQSTGPRTQTAAKPAAGPKVSPTDVQRLNRALTAAHIGEATDPNIPKAEQQEQTRKAKLGWVNGMLEDSGHPKVASVLEIPANCMAELIAKAEAGECPQGW